LRGTGTKCEPDTELANAFESGVSQHSVKTDGGQNEGEPGENGKEKGEETLRPPSILNAILHQAHIKDRLSGVDRTDNVTNGFFE